MALALVIASCGGSVDTAGNGAATTAEASQTTEALPEITLPVRPPADYAGFVTQPTACGADAPALLTPMTFAAPEDHDLDSTTVQATIVTSCGDIVVELDPRVAPDAVNSFVFLARQGYFNGSVSHRVVPGYILQAGDPTATGRQGPGYTINDELPEAGFLYERGVLAMGNRGPDSAGSQFFIMLADAELNNDFTYFGRVIDGFEALDRIAEVPLGLNAFGEMSVPLETLYIERVVVAP